MRRTLATTKAHRTIKRPKHAIRPPEPKRYGDRRETASTRRKRKRTEQRRRARLGGGE